MLASGNQQTTAVPRNQDGIPGSFRCPPALCALRFALAGNPPAVDPGRDSFFMFFHDNVNPGSINPRISCLIGKVPFKYQTMTIGGIPH